ncbi:hypothetical protein HYV49_00870 [Candidatus Pacearchaeota archaeon]|nr:hypothetical protein [Candidatus Pacearchaeota archaeon]
MSKKGKKEAEHKIEEFFADIKGKTPKEVRKIKKLAMSYNIKLKEKRKAFCKKCLTPFIIPKIRIKKGMKIIICDKCGAVSRWRMKD